MVNVKNSGAVSKVTFRKLLRAGMGHIITSFLDNKYYFEVK